MSMYCIRKDHSGWKIRNNATGLIKILTETEIDALLVEFPNLRDSKTVTYFRNRVKSINDLP